MAHYRSFSGGITLLLLFAPGLAQSQNSTSLMKSPNLGSGSATMRDPLTSGILSRVDLNDSSSRAILDSMRRLRDDYVQKQKDIVRERGEASPGKITALEVQKAREMEEYRRGEFCSGCGLTRSQILAKGEQFPHPGQHIVLPTKEQLAAKESEWDNKIAEAKQSQQAALLRLNRYTLESKQIVQNTERAVLEWRDAMRGEDDARAAAYSQKMDGFKTELADTRQAIQQDNRRIAAEQSQGAKASPELIAAYKNDLDRDLQHLTNIGVRAGEEFARGKMQSEAFSQSLNQGQQEVGGILSQIGGQFLIPPPTGLGSLAVKTPSSLPFSASISANSISFSGNLGVLRSTVAYSCDWLRSECKLNVSMGYSFPLIGSASGGFENTTTYSPNGVSTTPTPTAKVGPLDLMKGSSKSKTDNNPPSTGTKLP